MIIPFGRYFNLDTHDSRVPDKYLIWMCTKAEKDQMYGDPWDKTQFVIDGELVDAAHRELVARGYRCRGLRWERR